MRHHLDLEAIKARLPVARVLELNGLPIRGNRAHCPIVGICSGKTGESLAIFADGRAWTCHRCHEGGSVFDLLRHLEGGTLRQAMHRAAQLAAVDPSAPALARRAYSADPGKERRRLLAEQFRATAGARDVALAASRNPAAPLDRRADALLGARLLGRKLELLDRELHGDSNPEELAKLNRELDEVLARLERKSEVAA